MYSLGAVILVYGPTSWFRLQENELSVNNTVSLVTLYWSRALIWLDTRKLLLTVQNLNYVNYSANDRKRVNTENGGLASFTVALVCPPEVKSNFWFAMIKIGAS